MQQPNRNEGLEDLGVRQAISRDLTTSWKSVLKHVLQDIMYTIRIEGTVEKWLVPYEACEDGTETGHL